MRREKFVFWLRKDKPGEVYLIDLVYYLKSKREFSSTIRDGLRLIYALRQREWDVLFDMFPALSADIDKRILEAKIEAYEHAAARPIQVIQQQAQAVLIEQGSPKQPLLIADDDTPVNGPKRIEAPQFAAPAPDDDEFDLDIRAVQGGDSAQNFVSSVMNISQ